MEPIAVVFADSHLSSRIWAGRPIEGDAYYSFTQIIDYAIARKLPVLAGGDVIDQVVNRSRTIVFLSQQLDRLLKAGLEFLHIQGNHDRCQPSWLDGHAAARHIDGETVQVGPYQVRGLDYLPPPLLQVALGTLPAGTDILLAHEAFAEWMGGSASTDGKLSEIGTAHTVFAGDLHKLKKTRVSGRDGQELIAYSPGSTCLNSIDEDPAKYFLVLRRDGSAVPAPIRTRPLIDYGVLATPQDADGAVAGLPNRLEAAWDAASGYPEAVRAPIVKATYPHFLPGVEKRLLAAIRGRGHLFAKELPPDRVEPAGAAEAGEARPRGRAATLDSLLQEFLAERSLDGLHDLSRRLINAPDPAAELRAVRDEETIVA